MIRYANTHAENLPVIVLTTLVGTSLLAISAIVAIALWMSQTTNVVAAQTSSQLVASALQSQINRVAVSVRDYGEWPAAYEWVRNRDDDAVAENIGLGAVYDETFDVIYILTSEGAPLYAFKTDGGPSDTRGVDDAVAVALTEKLADLPLSPYSKVSAYAVLDGQLAAVVVGRIQPYDVEGRRPDEFDTIVGAVWLTPDTLRDIADRLMLSDMMLISVDAPTPEGFGSFILAAADDQPITQIIWRLSRPGDLSLERAVPIIIWVSVVLLVLSVIIGRASARQTAAFLTEHHRARRDQLTGVLNRTGLESLTASDKFRKVLADGQLAILYLDLNRFKELNDTAGHEAGDTALKITAERLKASVRKSDFVVRLGGDEFICLVVSASPRDTAREIAERFKRTALTPINIKGRSHIVSASVGIAVAEPGCDWRTLLKQADAAMFEAKKADDPGPVYSDRRRTAIEEGDMAPA